MPAHVQPFATAPERNVAPERLRGRHVAILILKYACAGSLLSYLPVIAQSSPIGLGDISNHLARAYIMADLIFHHGVRFGAQFEYHFLAVPYIATDLLLTGAVEVLGPSLAVASFTVLTFLSAPAALLLYFRVISGRRGKALVRDESAMLLLLCAAYLSTDFFFVVGFFAFQLGLACVIAILAVVEALRRRWSGGLFALYGAFVAAAYLVHLSTLLFLAVAVAGSAIVRLWSRSSTWRRELLLLSPLLALAAWHFGVAEQYHRPTDLAGAVYRWGTLRGKALWAAHNFHRYGGRLDEFLGLLYVASLLALVRARAWRDAFASPRVIEALALAAAFFGLYVALPFSFAEGTYIDIRALAPAALFLLLACLQLPRVKPRPRSSRAAPSLALVLALALSILNVAYLGWHFSELSSWSMEYRALFAEIPRSARVLPVRTLATLWPYTDPSTITVIDRQALVPDLFSANTGAPMTYFRYVDHPDMPADDWYITGSSPQPDWRQIACTYRDILITRPFDSTRIGVATHLVAETSSAALLAIDPRACRATGRAGRSDRRPL